MSRLVIAVYADCFNNKCGTTLPYIQFASQFGEVMLVHQDNNLERVVQQADVLLVPGGADVIPEGESPGFYNGRANTGYEYLDEHLLNRFIEIGKPVIGICRGFQTINRALGGNLYQHVIGHAQAQERYVNEQELTLIQDNITKVFGKPYPIAKKSKTIKVNSIHHQAVNRLGDGLIPLGGTPVMEGCYSRVESGDDQFTINNWYKFVEVFAHNQLPILGFQYHPEEFNCPFARWAIGEMLYSFFAEGDDEETEDNKTLSKHE